MGEARGDGMEALHRQLEGERRELQNGTNNAGNGEQLEQDNSNRRYR